MDVSLAIKHRLKELGLEQRALARAAHVTESYISQLLRQKKLPPAPNRTDVYDKIGHALKLPKGKLAELAELQRREQLRTRLGDPPSPLFHELRALLLSKCSPYKRRQIRVIFEKQAFGELERFVSHKLLGVAKDLVKHQLGNEAWVRQMARLNRMTDRQMRVAALEFLDTTSFHLPRESCIAFLNPLIGSWDIDLLTFRMEMVLNRGMAPGHHKTFEFMEKGAEPPSGEEPGFMEFLEDTTLSGDATEEERAFLRTLRFENRRPTALYYYRELQNLRDPLHFRPSVRRPQRNIREAQPVTRIRGS